MILLVQSNNDVYTTFLSIVSKHFFNKLSSSANTMTGIESCGVGGGGGSFYPAIIIYLKF